ncbi:putative ATP-grasp-modified RiPP [Streptomyces sp. NPDC050428]|uniref:putative ATP-grasp-modified RiPP n=1 Tax=Streptomyces sp. NPDC050428 TaxID=3155757 RepID=UPI0034293786
MSPLASPLVISPYTERSTAPPVTGHFDPARQITVDSDGVPVALTTGAHTMTDPRDKIPPVPGEREDSVSLW